MEKTEWLGCETGGCIRLTRTAGGRILYQSATELGELGTVEEFRQFIVETKAGIFDPLVVEIDQ